MPVLTHSDERGVRMLNALTSVIIRSLVSIGAVKLFTKLILIWMLPVNFGLYLY